MAAFWTKQRRRRDKERRKPGGISNQMRAKPGFCGKLPWNVYVNDNIREWPRSRTEEPKRFCKRRYDLIFLVHLLVLITAERSVGKHTHDCQGSAAIET